jgi:hypothetical protein
LDHFGWSLWTELLTGDKRWVDSLSLKVEEEFEPTQENWSQLFSKLDEVLKQSGLSKKLGGCFHTSSGVPNILQNVGMVSELSQAKTEYLKNTPFEFGMHSTFGKQDLVTMGNYPTVLKNDVKLCGLLGGTTIVEHPPGGTDKHIIEKVVDDLTSSAVLEIMQNTPISLSWENMSSSNAVFSELKNLVQLRESVSDKLKQIGKSSLIDKFQFCLDTGHLLLWRNRNKKGKKYADKQIEEYLPEFAKYIKVFHIHANNGKKDNHIVPYSMEFFDEPSRKGIKPKIFQKNSEIASEWLKICYQNKKLDHVHWHIEALILPFSLNQFIEFGKRLANIFNV